MSFASNRSLLVVDDEPIVCHSCTRIFGDQGFQVETINDSREGLKRATDHEYDAILLDIKMPNMDGIEFLEELRRTRTDVPVIMITGYASVPSAAAAMRLGATDYISKPFTPDEISQAVERLMNSTESGKDESPAQPEAVLIDATVLALEDKKTEQPHSATFTGYRFLDEAWLSLDANGSTRVGAFLPRAKALTIESVRLPEVGETLWRGLPMVAFKMAGGAERVIPSPVSGRVIEVHRSLADNPRSLWEHPCGEGWIARVRPSQLSDDLNALQSRRVLLASVNTSFLDRQVRVMSRCGCEMETASTAEAVFEALARDSERVVFLDTTTFGETGPSLVGRMNREFPDAKVVVIAPTNPELEGAYRKRKILYYAVEPIKNREIIEVLSAAFQAVEPTVAESSESSQLPQWIHRIRLINRHGQRVTLMPDGELLQRRKGLGCQLVRSMLAAGYPVEVDYGKKRLAAGEIESEAEQCDRIVILSREDRQQVAGSLVCRAGHALADGNSEIGAKTTTYSVQPGDDGFHFNGRSTQSLADHLMKAMIDDRSSDSAA